MRKITRDAVDAFMEGRNYSNSNTRVVHIPESRRNTRRTTMLLHDNLIAVKFSDESIAIQTCGWNTNTTKERLNGIPGVYIHQSKGKWYLNGIEWNGKLKSIKEQWYEIF